MIKKLSLKNAFLAFYLFFSVLSFAQVIPFAITNGFGTPATLPPGIQLVSYDGSHNCVSTPNGADAVTTMILKALPGYEFNIKNVSGLGARNADGPSSFNFTIVNNGTISGPVTEVPASSNCGTNTTLPVFNVPLENQLVTSGNSISMMVQRHAGTTQGTGYSHVKSFVVIGEVRVSTPVANEATGILANGFMANWDPVTNATGYLLDVSTSPDFASMLPGYNNLSVPGTSLFVEYNLVPGVTYYYRVRAKIQILGSANSNTISVVMACAAIDAPVGAAQQEFAESDTISALEVLGSNVVWYADAELTQPLSSDVLLADTVTYYAVSVNGSCMSAPLAVTAYLNLNVDKSEKTTAIVYPNPAIGVINIKSESVIEQLSFYNLLGQEVLNVNAGTNTEQVNIATLQPGAYLVKVKTLTGLGIVKFLKK